MYDFFFCSSRININKIHIDTFLLNENIFALIFFPICWILLDDYTKKIFDYSQMNIQWPEAAISLILFKFVLVSTPLICDIYFPFSSINSTLLCYVGIEWNSYFVYFLFEHQKICCISCQMYVHRHTFE